MKLHHIGYLVKDLDISLCTFIGLGFLEFGERFHDEERQADILFLEKDGYCVELISPWSESKLNGMMKYYKNTGYHLCFQVEDIDTVSSKLQEEGKWRRIVRKASAGAISDTAVVEFLIHPDIGMIELLQMGNY